MTATRTLAQEALRLDVARRLAPAVRAASASMGPNGRATLYASGSSVRHASTGVDVIRRVTGDSVIEKLFREGVVSADQDIRDGSARLAVMFGAALEVAQAAIAAGVYPTALVRAVDRLAPELDIQFAAETMVADDLRPLLRAADLQEDVSAALARALERAGPEGHVELSERPEPGVELQEASGFTAEMEAALTGSLDHMDRVYLIVANDIISDFDTLVPVIEGFAKSDKSLVIAARGIEGAARQLLERNRTAGVLRVAALVPCDKGPRAVQILADLAVATGATLVAEETGQSLARLSPGQLGSAGGYRRRGNRITLTDPGGEPDAIALRLGEIEGEIERHRYLALDREHAQRRHARLSGRWVELMVGPDRTRPDLHAHMTRALASVRSARAGGWMSGAGQGLCRIAEHPEAGQGADATDRAARRVLCQALRAPQKALRRNAGFDDSHVNWASGLPELADPVQLSRSLLDTAVSLALQVMTLEIAILRN